MADRPQPFELIFGDPNVWEGIADPANAERLSTFRIHLTSYVAWLRTCPARTPQEETAIQGLKEVLDDDAVFNIVRAMPAVHPLSFAERSTMFNRNYPHCRADTASGWLLRKLWHRLPTDANTMGDTFEEQLAWEVHDRELEYRREEHKKKKAKPATLQELLDDWERLKAEYETFMAKKAAQTGTGSSQGGEVAAGEREGENEGAAESGKDNEAGKEPVSLSWADF